MGHESNRVGQRKFPVFLTRDRGARGPHLPPRTEANVHRPRAREDRKMSSNAMRRSASLAVRSAMREGGFGATMTPKSVGAPLSGNWNKATEGYVRATRFERDASDERATTK